MRTRLLALLLALAMAAGFVAMSGCGKQPEEVGGGVSRGEWLAMLAESFGLNDSENTAPYYKDITARHELFPAVQGLGNWDILVPFAGDTLEPSKPVTRQEVATTAAIAAGFQVGETFEPEQAAQFAAQYGILALEGGAPTREECQAALDAAQAVYLENPGEEKRVAVMNPELVDLGEVPLTSFQVGEGSVTLSAAAISAVTQDDSGNVIAELQTKGGRVQLGVGKTFVTAPEGNEAWGRAYKITSAQAADDGSVRFETTDPTLGDVYDKLELHTTVGLEDGYITWADGVMAEPVHPADSLSAGAGNYRVELLSGGSQGGGFRPSRPQNRQTIPIYFSDKTGPFLEKLTESLGNSEAEEALRRSGFTYGRTPSLQDFEDLSGSVRSWTKELDKDTDGPLGYELSGELTFGISVTTDLLYSRLNYENESVDWPPSASLTANTYARGELKWEGKYELEKKIASIDIPIVTGLSARGSVILYATASGSVEVTVELEGFHRAQWHEKGGRARGRRPMGRNSATGELSGAIDLSCDIGAALDLCFFQIKIIGAEVKMGALFEAEGAVVGDCDEVKTDSGGSRTYTQALKLSLGCYAPIVTLEVSGPEHLKDTLGLKVPIPLIDKEHAKHFMLYEKTIPFWSKTVELDPEGNIISQGGPEEGNFAEFAGTYRADAAMVESYGVQCPDLVLHEDGTITGGGFLYGWDPAYDDHFAGNAPISVEEYENGAFYCRVVYRPPSGNEDFNDGYEESYTLYPAGVSTGRSDKEDIHTVRLLYLIGGPGAIDMIYTRID